MPRIDWDDLIKKAGKIPSYPIKVGIFVYSVGGDGGYYYMSLDENGEEKDISEMPKRGIWKHVLDEEGQYHYTIIDRITAKEHYTFEDNFIFHDGVDTIQFVADWKE